MSAAITMPALSDTMSNGRLVKWTKKPGDKVKKGDVIAEVETDKAVMEVEAFQDGYLSGPLAAEGTEAPVGETIGYISDSPAEVSERQECRQCLGRPIAGRPEYRNTGQCAACLRRLGCVDVGRCGPPRDRISGRPASARRL